MPETEDRQAIVDQEQLRLLSIGYFISGSLSSLFSLFGLAYAFMGVFMSRVIARAPAAEQPPPEIIGWFFGIFGLGMFAIMVTLGILKLSAGFQLRKRRSRIFCLVVGAICCLGGFNAPLRVRRFPSLR